MRTRLAAAIAVAVSLFVIASRQAGELPRLTPARTSASGEEGFPRTVVDDQGYALTLPAPPQRIVSHSLVADHYLTAIVPHDRLVAVSNFGKDARYSHVSDILTRLDLPAASDAERIMRLKPDLTLISNISSADFVELLRAGGVPTFRLFSTVERFSEIADGLRTVGRLTGEEAAAEAVIERMNARIAAVKARPRNASAAPKVLAYSAPGYTYGYGSLFDHIVTELGGVNVAGVHGIAPSGNIGSEQVAAWNPDWIVAGADPGTHEAALERLLEDPGVRISTAGQKRQFLIVDNRDYFSSWQDSVVLMEKLAAALYPGGT